LSGDCRTGSIDSTSSGRQSHSIDAPPRGEIGCRPWLRHSSRQLAWVFTTCLSPLISHTTPMSLFPSVCRWHIDRANEVRSLNPDRAEKGNPRTANRSCWLARWALRHSLSGGIRQYSGGHSQSRLGNRFGPYRSWRSTEVWSTRPVRVANRV